MKDLFILLVPFYIYAGDKANRYLKYYVLGVQAEIYGDTFNYLLSRALYGLMLGWATIPIAILHYKFIRKDNAGE